ncbi:hypothetical protein [Streptomyces thioluteus]|uniref:hypothetical protein n=1 Tax=Streptomyces thioluteus TaxID=66431 RepID=UPI0031EA2437
MSVHIVVEISGALRSPTASYGYPVDLDPTLGQAAHRRRREHEARRLRGNHVVLYQAQATQHLRTNSPARRV